jgi:putative tricarboxylic transport membrane protein
MMDHSAGAAEPGPSHRLVEIGTALFIALFGAIVIYGSLQVGIGWGAEGPKAGFFPFYLGVIIVASSVINLGAALSIEKRQFASWPQLRQVLSVIVPTAIYVAVIPTIGIYVSSMLLIAGFMKWLGRYPWLLVIALAVGVPVAFFLMFEKWFLVPLPKGPLEEWLGL